MSTVSPALGKCSQPRHFLSVQTESNPCSVIGCKIVKINNILMLIPSDVKFCLFFSEAFYDPVRLNRHLLRMLFRLQMLQVTYDLQGWMEIIRIDRP